MYVYNKQKKISQYHLSKLGPGILYGAYGSKTNVKFNQHKKQKSVVVTDFKRIRPVSINILVFKIMTLEICNIC
jgi:hypothetical protein